ncbi:LysR family transcriptional regulator [Aestuariirhabdus sp. Z084]|uniref:LysR family transcriptional regulator n=1 Tax=Aestuariirhabdus haliotis TaxID=2918751 RepID=UPI00201B3F97|nr:LysR family transcriptional regulator [Aestuariirhabdus haliotis]MCL6415273.1 LysR family transcriptional regulator [Aestuariirhabdus haliotis]MCL6419533.1 LysR family transcriptional regulator [Aestuariirhabdus haliotis]
MDGKLEGFGALPVFVAVVEAGGFSPAARQLGISKSAVSKRMTLLEQQLGVKLLHRTTRKLSLTEAGEHYFEHAAKAYRAARDAEDAVLQLQGEPQGRLRINTPMSFGRLHIAPMMPAFLKRYPKISIDMVMDDKTVDLVDGGFDLAIRAGDLVDSSLIARPLAPLRSMLCASPAYLAEQGTPGTLSELAEHNCLVFSYSNDVKEWTFIKPEGNGAAPRKETVAVNGNFRVNNSEALRELMLRGVGIGRLPTFVTGPDIRSGQLVQLFPEYEMPSITMNAVFLERQYMPAKVRAFLDFALDYFGGDTPYWDR